MKSTLVFVLLIFGCGQSSDFDADGDPKIDVDSGPEIEVDSGMDPSFFGTTETSETITVDEQVRTYTLVRPTTLPATPRPLILFFHGGGTAVGWTEKSGLNPITDENGWYSAYPQAQSLTNNTWESGSWGPSGNEPRMGTADFTMVADLISDLAARFPIDQSKVFAVGFSNGGHFVHRLACQRGGLLRGVVSGGASRTLAADEEGCVSEALPFLILNGSADSSSPHDCDTPDTGCMTRGGPFIGAVQTAEAWATQNGCPSDPIVSTWPLVEGGFQIYQDVYGSCDSQNEVTLVEVVDYGHKWPGTLTQSDLNATWIMNWLMSTVEP